MQDLRSKDSTNALVMYDTTKEDWEKIVSRQASETNIFDKINTWIKQRKWPYILQWASEGMLVHKIQKLVLDFNDNMKKY